MCRRKPRFVSPFRFLSDFLLLSHFRQRWRAFSKISFIAIAECGLTYTRDNRIVGGHDIGFGKVPWQVINEWRYWHLFETGFLTLKFNRHRSSKRATFREGFHAEGPSLITAGWLQPHIACIGIQIIKALTYLMTLLTGFRCTCSTATSGIRVRLGEWNMKDNSEPLPHEDFDIDRKEVIHSDSCVNNRVQCVWLVICMTGSS